MNAQPIITLSHQDQQHFIHAAKTLKTDLSIAGDVYDAYKKMPFGYTRISEIYGRYAGAKAANDYARWDLNDFEKSVTPGVFMGAGAASVFMCGWFESAAPLITVPIIALRGAYLYLKNSHATTKLNKTCEEVKAILLTDMAQSLEQQENITAPSLQGPEL